MNSAEALSKVLPSKEQMEQIRIGAVDAVKFIGDGVKIVYDNAPSQKEIGDSAVRAGKAIGDTYTAAGDKIKAARDTVKEKHEQMKTADFEGRCDNFRLRQYACGIPKANEVVKFLEGGSAGDFHTTLQRLNREIESIQKPEQMEVIRGSDYCKWLWSNTVKRPDGNFDIKKLRTKLNVIRGTTHEKEEILSQLVEQLSIYLKDMRNQRKEVEQLLHDLHCQTYAQDTDCNANWGGKKTRDKMSITYCDAKACGEPHFNKAAVEFLEKHKTTDALFHRIMYE